MNIAGLKRRFLLLNLILAIAVGGFLIGVLPAQVRTFLYDHVASELEMAAGSIALSMRAYDTLQDLSMLQEISEIIGANPDVGAALIYVDSGAGFELLTGFPYEAVAAGDPDSAGVAADTAGVAVREFAGANGQRGRVLVRRNDAQLQGQTDTITLALAGLFALFLTLQLSLLALVSGNLLAPLALVETQVILQAQDLLPPELVPAPGQLQPSELVVLLATFRSERSLARASAPADDAPVQSFADQR